MKGTTDLSKLYKFSKSFGPPKTNLREAQIEDCYGDGSSCTMEINHQAPEDVTFEELKFYPQTFTFMDMDSCLFYAYSVFKYYDNEDKAGYWRGGIDCFFYYIENHLEDIIKSHNSDILFDSIKTLWNESPYFFSLPGCLKLQRYLQIFVNDEDQINYWLKGKIIKGRNKG